MRTPGCTPALSDAAETARLTLDPLRNYYVHVVRGDIDVKQVALGAGDATAIKGESVLELSGGKASEVLVFDLSPR